MRIPEGSCWNTDESSPVMQAGELVAALSPVNHIGYIRAKIKPQLIS